MDWGNAWFLSSTESSLEAGDSECQVKPLSLVFGSPSSGRMNGTGKVASSVCFRQMREKGKIVEEVCQRISECLIRKFLWVRRGMRT